MSDKTVLWDCKRFYLDIKSEKIKEHIRDTIQNLGGKVVHWFDYKVVTEVVTNRNIRGVCYVNPKTRSKVIPADVPVTKTTQIKHTVTTSMHTIRMKKLIQGVVQPNSQPQDVLQIANQYDIPVFYLTHFCEYINDISYHQTTPLSLNKKRKMDENDTTTTSNNNNNNNSPHKKQKLDRELPLTTPLSRFKKKIIKKPLSPVRVEATATLKEYATYNKEPFILVEDITDKYHPFHKKFDQGCPSIFYERTDKSPFVSISTMNSTPSSNTTTTTTTTDDVVEEKIRRLKEIEDTIINKILSFVKTTTGN